ncbi:MAG: DNA repair protein RecN [Gaiellales bacterium]
MLNRLLIENLVLIERAELELAPGLNVFSGETGAGKTMLAQAIGLLAGAQPGAALVGPHGAEAYVEAEIELPDGLLDEPALAAVADLRPDGEDTLVIARRLLSNGRTRAMVWGRSCARADLEALGERLLEVSSQHEARRLAQPAHQLALLDSHAGAEPAVREMAEAWRELRAARAAVEQAKAQADDANRRRAELEALVERVDAAAVQPGERAALEAERGRLRHLDELMAASAGAGELLNPDEGEGALSLAARAAELVAGGARYEAGLGDVAGELRDATVRLQEAALELRAYADGLEADPGRLEQVEARLELFTELERRFDGTLDEVLERADSARAALELAQSSGRALDRLEQRVEQAQARATSCAKALSAVRRRASRPFARAVERELAELGMDGAHFQVLLSPADLGPRGADRVELVLAANPGLPAAPVARTASGGELSRIALAIRIAARESGGPGTLLLDEVDAGVGGRTARVVGEKLRLLAEGAQVLCITHLPQIAGLAEAHFRVEKQAGDPASTAVERLVDDAVLDELARMLGGDGDGDGRTARLHAESLRAE